MASANGGAGAGQAWIETRLKQLGSRSGRSQIGTDPELRRYLVASNASEQLLRTYASLYSAAMAESLIVFLHLSKSGGTALCHLAKTNGCWRAGAGDNTFTANCADKELRDDAWWLPHSSLAQFNFRLRRFATGAFAVPEGGKSYQDRSCRARGVRAAGLSRSADSSGATPTARHGAARTHLQAGPTFFAVEGAMPEATRCRGILETVVLRDPIDRLGSFGRELDRWGLLPVDGRPDTNCRNFSRMLQHAPSVYDNQLVRSLLGGAVYASPAGTLPPGAFKRAQERLRQMDVLLLTGTELLPMLQQRLGWGIGAYSRSFGRASPRAARRRCELDGEQRGAAEAQNHWDLLLFREAQALAAADERFFAHPAVVDELATKLHRRDGSIGCGLVAEPQPRTTGPGRSLCVLPPRVLSRGPASSLHRPCCSTITQNRIDPHCPPPLPHLHACILPPAGMVSSEKVVLLPPFDVTWSHASCAIACAARQHPPAPRGARGDDADEAVAFSGLENSGRFCFCLPSRVVHSHVQLHARECAGSCSETKGALVRRVRPKNALHCGGVDAVAVFDLADTLSALSHPSSDNCSSASIQRELPPRLRRPLWAGNSCVSVADVCSSRRAEASSRSLFAHLAEASSRSLFAHLASGSLPSAPSAAAPIGCFSARSLETVGRWWRQKLPTASTPSAGSKAPPLQWRCKLACASFSYFAIGADAAGDGDVCECGDLPHKTWRRDSTGMHGLARLVIRPLATQG